MHYSSTTTKPRESSSSTDSSTRRKRICSMVKEFHSYSTSPRTVKVKLQRAQNKQVKTRRKLYQAKKTVKSLKIKVRSLKTVIADLRKNQNLSEHALFHLEKSYEEIPDVLMARYLKNREARCTTREKYPEKLRSFACTLQFYSSKAYEYVRQTFALGMPSQSTIRKWYANVNCFPGYCTPAFDALKCKVDEATINNKKLICGLMLDEMSLRKQVEFDGKRTWGYVDLGTGIQNDSLEPASEVLVLMVVALNAHWKIPIAYFLIKSLTGKEKANIVFEALTRLENSKVKIISLTCDGPSAHLTMLTELGCKLDDLKNLQPWFSHPTTNEQIFCFLDACHMLKLARNMLGSLCEIKNAEGKAIKWLCIKKLHELQDSETLNLANKLKKNHIEWQRQKMKVSLAAQTLSASVADALDFLCDDLQHPDFQDVKPTVEFVRRIDAIFDLLNSRCPWSKGFKAPLRESNQNTWRPYLLDSIEYLLSLNDVAGREIWRTARKTPIIGFIMCIRSAIGAFDAIVTGGPLEYLLTYKFSQDHLEMFFCCVRSRNGFNNNPSCLQFMQTFRRLLLHTKIDASGRSGNCRVLDDTVILTVPSQSTVQMSGSNMPDIPLLRRYGLDALIEEERDHDYDILPIAIDFNNLTANIVTYISGYVIKMLKRRFKCPDCVEGCIGHEFDEDYRFLFKKNKGGLYIPTKGVTTICLSVEGCIRRFMDATEGRIPRESNFFETFTIAISQKFYGQGKVLFPHLEEHFIDYSTITNNHTASLIKAIVGAYVRIRFFNLCKRFTSVIQGKSIRQELNKLILFNHQ
ncbi:hypothetical protein PPYR_11875 [Photinus pyralis]|uniref:THAP-type domain-containing protein n=1 Tax=Photinus pyralis TaxID=7054 RepID=A0A5N4ACJ4_PHOPY|nr:hypothetical protein PPYR_11875 [Photinus pyralis]